VSTPEANQALDGACISRGERERTREEERGEREKEREREGERDGERGREGEREPGLLMETRFHPGTSVFLSTPGNENYYTKITT